MIARSAMVHIVDLLTLYVSKTVPRHPLKEKDEFQLMKQNLMLLKIVYDDVYGRHASDIPPSAQTNGHIQACRDQIRALHQTGR